MLERLGICDYIGETSLLDICEHDVCAPDDYNPARTDS
jgi:hypothetical protein